MQTILFTQMKLQDEELLFVFLCNEKSKDENLMNLDINCMRGVDTTIPEFADKTALPSAYDCFLVLYFTFNLVDVQILQLIIPVSMKLLH